MPKNKTHSGMKKRVRRTGSGKFMRERTNNRHLLEHKRANRKRRNGQDNVVDRTNLREVRRLLGI